MTGPIRPIEPGEMFYLFGDKIHYIGCVGSNEDKVHVFRGWNKYKKRCHYEVMTDGDLADNWRYLQERPKTRP